MASGDGDVAFVRQNTIYQMTANSTGKYKVDVSHTIHTCMILGLATATHFLIWSQ